VQASLTPARSRVGRPREVDLRDAVNALLFIASTGCQWRMLLKSIRVGYATMTSLSAACPRQGPQSGAANRLPNHCAVCGCTISTARCL
jgi:transposase